MILSGLGGCFIAAVVYGAALMSLGARMGSVGIVILGGLCFLLTLPILKVMKGIDE